MMDDRANAPGSENAKSHAPRGGGPPSPQAPSYEATDAPEPDQAARSWRWPCLILGLAGCGCLVVILLGLGIIGGVGWSIFNESTEAVGPTNGNEPAPGDALEPGLEAVMTWAVNRRPEWEATVNDHSEDWLWARLVMGPSGSDGTTWVEIEWDAPAGRYVLLDEGPLGAQEALPDSYRPGEEAAMEAALAYAEQPGWVARVDSHSDDWRRATVSVGPPASEFIYVVALRWDASGDYYDLVAIDDVDYPGVE